MVVQSKGDRAELVQKLVPASGGGRFSQVPCVRAPPVVWWKTFGSASPLAWWFGGETGWETPFTLSSDPQTTNPNHRLRDT